MYVPADYALASFVYTENVTDTGTEPYVWTLGIKNDSVNDWPVVANEMCTIWQDTWAPETSDAFVLDHVDLLVNAGGSSTGVVTSTEDPVIGEVTVAVGYNAFAPKVRKVTGRLGRKGRGLCHPVGVLSLSDISNNGTISTTRRAELEAVCTAWGTAMFTAGYVGYLLHTDAADGDPDLITGFVVSPKVGVLRKRMV